MELGTQPRLEAGGRTEAGGVLRPTHCEPGVSERGASRDTGCSGRRGPPATDAIPKGLARTQRLRRPAAARGVGGQARTSNSDPDPGAGPDASPGG